MNLIYETPWWLPTGLVIAGIVLLIAGNNRLDKRLMRSGLIGLLLGVIVATVSFMLESPRETVIRQTRSLVAAVENRDWKTMENLMQPDVSLADFKTRQAVLDAAKRYTERYRLKSVRITSIEAVNADPDISVILQAAADVLEGWSPPTNWKLDWERTDHGWRLASIEPHGGPALDVQIIDRILRAR
jgi:hypothetical protein